MIQNLFSLTIYKLISILFNYFSELGRFEANITVLSGGIVAFLYWFTQYKTKK